MSKLKKMILRFFVLLLSSLVLLSSSIVLHPSSIVYAAVPHLINYQGRLTDSSGVPLNSTYDLTFRIYDAEAAGNLLWQETHSAVLIQKGIFSIMLGSVTSMDLPFDKAYFLEIKVGSEVMSPRQRIASAGYAIRAEKAETLNASGQKGDILYYDGSNWIGLSAGISGQFLKTQGVGANPVWAPITNYMNIQVFTSSGTFIKPQGVDKVFVEVVGGGGGGACCNGGSGGGGGYAAKICTLTGDVSVNVGAGGVNGDRWHRADGGDGDTSSFGVFCSANGGKSGGNGGAGGTAAGGDINIQGQSGGNQIYAGDNGNNKSGDGGNSIYGFGARGVDSEGDGQNGIGYGGGGSAGCGGERHGASGAAGVVIVRW